MNSFLVDPALRGLAIGSAEWFAAQRRMIRHKPLIRYCYELWYRRLLEDEASVPARFPTAKILELGSGSSFIKELRPEVITSDVEPGVADLVVDGQSLPFPNTSLRAIFVTHVFHHLPDVAAFLGEAARTLVPGGVISMVEVAHTPFARFFFQRCHPEPYDDRRTEWSFPPGHTMLDSNQALSWIVFRRDAAELARRFPMLRLERWRYLPWFSYMIAGGVNFRTLVPRWSAPAVKVADALLRPLDGLFAVHWHLTVRKVET
jgi:SAM-dependent methyltransferase